jgi:cellulose synthase (UDP-forming)
VNLTPLSSADTFHADDLPAQNTPGRRALLRGTIIAGFIASLYFFSWWTEDRRYAEPLQLLLLAVALFYVLVQIYAVWFLYWNAGLARRKHGLLPSGLSVDVFVPTYNEPPDLIEKVVRAAVDMRYPHTTYVLDDGRSEAVRTVAARLGAQYVSRPNNTDNKAGNINEALARSSGDFIVVFDVDHVPEPDFIERSLAYFDDPRIGVVQVALDHYNTHESFVATASGEMNDDFFAATMLGMDRCGAASVFGSNSVFRREALTTMGGYQPGLAEDLNTSLHLHAAGWKSAYAPEILAKGLVPADLPAFVAQQYKWARGVFDVFLQEFPRLAHRLSWRQRISYITRMTYYLAGPLTFIHLLYLAAVPLSGGGVVDLLEYIRHITPFVLLFIFSHMLANGMYAVKPPAETIRWKGILLAIGSWPVYTAALLASLLGTRASYIPTPKEATGTGHLRFSLPQIALFLVFLGTLAGGFLNGHSGILTLGLIFIPGYVLLHLGILRALPPSRRF